MSISFVLRAMSRTVEGWHFSLPMHQGREQVHTLSYGKNKFISCFTFFFWVGQEGALKIPELLSLRSWVLLGLGQAEVGSISKRGFWIFCRASDLPSGRVCHLPRHCRPASGSFSGTKSLYLLPRGLAVPSALVTFPLSVQIPHPANHTPQFLLLLNLKMHVCLA